MTEAQQSIAAENHKLIYVFLKQFNLSVEDYYGLAAIGMCKAAIYYGYSKGKSSIFAFRCVFCAMQKRKPEETFVYYDAEMEVGCDRSVRSIEKIPSPGNTEKELLSRFDMEEKIAMLTDRYKQIVYLLNEGYSRKEIGDRLGYSQSWVSRMVKNLDSIFVGQEGL